MPAKISPTPAESQPAGWRTTALHILAFVVVVGISLYISTIRDQARRLAAFGYPGIFLVSVLANATVLLPAPGVAFVFAMGSILNPAIVALTAGVGATVGELSGYLAGYSGQNVIQRLPIYARIHGWMKRYGMWTVFVLAAVPNPFFDLAGMAAGALKMPLWQFVVPCLAGKIVKMLAFAYTGAYSIEWLANLLP